MTKNVLYNKYNSTGSRVQSVGLIWGFTVPIRYYFISFFDH